MKRTEHPAATKRTKAPPATSTMEARAAAWGAYHGMPAHLWLGPDLDPLPEPQQQNEGTDA